MSTLETIQLYIHNYVHVYLQSKNLRTTDKNINKRGSGKKWIYSSA